MLVTAAVVFASQQGSGDGGGGPLNAIAEAAVKTQGAGGGRAVLRGTIAEAGQSQPDTLTGRVAYDDSGMARGTITVFKPGSSDSVKLEYVQDGTQMYMRSSRFGTLPEGREWMGLDLAFGDDLDTSPAANGDVRGELELLAKASGGVDAAGKEKVRGVSTTRYRSRISVADSVRRLREEGADTAASNVEKKGAPMQVEAWIDGKGLVRRMRLLQTRPGEEGGSPKTVDMRTDFYDFGYEPEIEVPDSDEVFDATSLAQEQIAPPVANSSDGPAQGTPMPASARRA